MRLGRSQRRCWPDRCPPGASRLRPSAPAAVPFRASDTTGRPPAGWLRGGPAGDARARASARLRVRGPAPARAFHDFFATSARQLAGAAVCTTSNSDVPGVRNGAAAQGGCTRGPLLVEHVREPGIRKRTGLPASTTVTSGPRQKRSPPRNRLWPRPARISSAARPKPGQRHGGASHPENLRRERRKLAMGLDLRQASNMSSEVKTGSFMDLAPSQVATNATILALNDLTLNQIRIRRQLSCYQF